jgi:hypothetical protein
MKSRDYRRATAKALARFDGPELVLGSTGDRLVVVDQYDRILTVKITSNRPEIRRYVQNKTNSTVPLHPPTG